MYLLLSKKATCVLYMWTSQVHIPIFECLDETYYYTTSLYKKKALITAWLVKKFQTTTSKLQNYQKMQLQNVLLLIISEENIS